MNDHQTVARNLFDAVNARAWDRLNEVIGTEARWVDMTTGQTWRGPEGIRKYFESFVTAMPDYRVDITNLFAAPGSVAVEMQVRGTHKNALKLLDEEIPASNRKAETNCCTVIRMTNDQVMEARTYYDALGLRRQLGAHTGKKN